VKVMVIHDKAGKIEGLAVPGPELAGRIQMAPRKGRQVTEVEVDDLKGDVLSKENQERLLGIVDRFRLDTGPGGPRLAPAAKASRKAGRARG
jgi:hypothetical protein